MNWEEKILTYLADHYRNSKKDSGDNKNSRRTQLKPEKIYKKYKANDGDFDAVNALNKTVENLTACGYVTCDRERFGTQLQNIYLVDEKIDEIENYLHDNYGYITKQMKKNAILEIIKKFESASEICKRECTLLKNKLEANRIPSNYENLPEIFSMIAFLENNYTELYIREASMNVYGDSKYFEEKTLEPVCKMLRKYRNKPCEDEELLDEVLLDYHIRKEPQKYCLKGDFSIEIGGTTIDFGALSCGVEFDTRTLLQIDKIIIHAPKFMTIENRASYLRYSAGDTVTFYLGGYANRFQRDFIKKVHEDNPDITYLHFGDIDAGGFWIHHNLCVITGVKFDSFCMSKRELESDKYKKCLQPLSGNDISRLQGLQEMEQYSDTVNYMLENNVKLEQEIVSLELMNK